MDINVTFPSEEYFRLTDKEVNERILVAKSALGDSLFILGHHYQRDEVIRYADAVGDSLGLSKKAAQTSAKFIVFCGVHFMAETADIITAPDQVVFMPDVTAGCSLADMANIDQVEKTWQKMHYFSPEKTIPITYINSNVALKAFCGKNDGIVCTSSNAQKALEWAWSNGKRIFFFPDQFLGLNMAYRMGVPLEQILVWDQNKPFGGHSKQAIEKSRLILWNGSCCVHQEFSKEQIDLLRQGDPAIQIISHPECNFEVVQSSDFVGSTEFIIRKISDSPDGTHWGIGTEKNLVNRLKNRFPNKKIVFLQNYEPFCVSMSQTTSVHLLFILENLAKGNLINQVLVESEYRENALTALNRMLELA
ncbi:MAG: quinolinate synthase NadA [Candidatus Marinimicrobia bacterium]|nr:quinolinate synthase NadA [Candidatus Neomarinimicrobiota bacterium]